MTRNSEIAVPCPRYIPMEDIVSFEVRNAMMTPAIVRMLPEVSSVGNARFIVSIMAAFGSMTRLSSR